ncbi:hypothetical protein DV736_g5901, partial [Chaetothyriales sp. CBS 134916]
MSRRDLVPSSENAALSQQLEEQLSLDDPPEVTLRKAFSVTSAISTTSSLARRYREAATDQSLQKFRAIGQGSFGTVYEQTGTPYIFKGEIHPSLGENLLWEELVSHKVINEAFESIKMLGINVHVPKVTDYITEDDLEWWEEHIEKFAEDNKNLPERRDLIKAERIYPVPQIIRESLINVYCPDAVKNAAGASKANKDCLVRLYLGKDTDGRQSRFFTLRNFRLHKNQMEKLGLNLKLFAEAMGQALAVIHWIAGTDARDVEFVLGSSPTEVHDIIPNSKELRKMLPRSKLQPQVKGFHFEKRLVHIWCLDFNQVQHITLDTAGVQMCVDAFFANDPYYPRPGSTALWATFSNSYLTTEKALQKCENLPSMAKEDIQKIRTHDLARLFLDAVETRWLQQQETKN